MQLITFQGHPVMTQDSEYGTDHVHVCQMKLQINLRKHTYCPRYLTASLMIRNNATLPFSLANTQLKQTLLFQTNPVT